MSTRFYHTDYTCPFSLSLFFFFGKGLSFLEPRRDGIRRIVNGYPVEVANFLPGQFNRPLIGRPTFTSVDSTSVRAPANPLIRAALREPSPCFFFELLLQRRYGCICPERFSDVSKAAKLEDGWIESRDDESYSHIERASSSSRFLPFFFFSLVHAIATRF